MGFPVIVLAELALKIANRALDNKRIITGPAKINVATELEVAIKSDPVLRNQLNAEPAVQSRVAWGAVAAALGVVLPPLFTLIGWNVDSNYIVEFIGACVTLWGAGYTIYGRFKTGLKPLFSKG